MPSTDLPWIEYTGQTTSELIACGQTHRMDSLLCAFEQGIQARLDPENDSSITEEEQLVLAVMALDREVNNGGYYQCFVNSSCGFVPIIVECLRTIGCPRVAAITERALAALGLAELSADAVSAAIRGENAGRDEVLNGCDTEYYALSDIGPNLFRFIQDHHDQIRTGKPPRTIPRPRAGKPQGKTMLWVQLILSKANGLDLAGVRKLAHDLARQNSLEITDEELESASVLYAFKTMLARRDIAGCEPLAALALNESRDDPAHIVFHRQWVELLLESGRKEAADEQSLRYLNELARREQSALVTRNRILFWAELLRGARADLPNPVRFFVTSFPQDNLDGPLPKMPNYFPT